MLVGLIALSTFASMSCLIWGLLRRPASTMEARIRTFRQQAITPVQGEVDLSIPFADRVIKPSLEAIARLATSVLPASVLANLEKRLIMAGSPMSASTFVTLWVGLGSLFSAVILAAVFLVGGSIGVQQALVVLLCGIIGLVLPNFWLKGQVKARQKLIVRALPDALDMVTTCVEAGLGLDAALARVTEKSSGPLADELSRTLREVAMGRLRREALTDLGARTGVEELITFINAIIQAEQLGVAIAQVLRVQSEQMRTRRRQRAEQAAHEAPIKMLFPLVLFIFPSFMLVILGPAVIRIGEALFLR